MSAHLDDPQLEALAAREVAEPEAEEHAGMCLRCGGKLLELRREGRALSRWVDARGAAGGSVEHLWEELQARLPVDGAPLQLQPRPRRWAAMVVAAAALATAASVLMPIGPLRRAPAAAPATKIAESDADDELPTPSARAALERAEGEYRHAAQVMQAKVAARGALAAGRASKGALALAHAHGQLGAQAGARSRVRVLGGYAAWLKSLRRALDEAAERE